MIALNEEKRVDPVFEITITNGYRMSYIALCFCFKEAKTTKFDIVNGTISNRN